MKKPAKKRKKPLKKTKKKRGPAKQVSPAKPENSPGKPSVGGAPQVPTPENLPKSPPRAPKKPKKPGRPPKVDPPGIPEATLQPPELPATLPEQVQMPPTISDRARAGARMLTRLEVSVSNKLWEPVVAEDEVLFVEETWYDYLLAEGGEIPPWLGVAIAQLSVFGLRYHASKKKKKAKK